MIEVQLGALSNEIEMATVQEWFFEEGDAVAKGDNIVELVIEDGTVILTAPVSGVLLEVYYDEGETVEKTDVLCQIDDEAATLEDSSEE